jgi:uncharacterized protein (DUF779 family)
MSEHIVASAAAQKLIDDLHGQHGPLSFHYSGRVGGALLCLPEGELRIGGFDVLMGRYRGMPVYMRSDDATDWAGRALLIGVTTGLPRGFSLESPSGCRFVLHPSPHAGPH